MKHAYFHQLQMKLCEVNCGDFIIWREDELVILRIKKDEVFLKDKATEFFKYGVLSELVGKGYTRVPLTSPDMQLPMQESSSSSEPTKTPQTSTEQKWCYCNGEDFLGIKMTQNGSIMHDNKLQNRKNCTRQNIPQQFYQLHLSLFLYHIYGQF